MDRPHPEALEFDIRKDPYNFMSRLIFSGWKPFILRAMDFDEGNLTHFAQFDQVLWLENGTARIADPATMMAENPAYARLVKTQQKKAGDDDEK